MRAGWKLTQVQLKTVWHSARRLIARGLILAAVLLAIAWCGLRFVPLPERLFAVAPMSLELTDRHGVRLREVRTGEQYTREFRLEHAPESLVRAMLAAEDKRFWAHGGVDFLAIGRAAVRNILERRITSGASTITQQLIKQTAPRRRTLRTKVAEAVQAMRLEQVWSKEQILEAYLARIDFGNLNIGVTAAADFYFGKPLADLTEAEAAFLAGLPKNPKRLNPHRHLRAAQRRQHTVLRRMLANGWLDQERYDRALAEPIRLRAPRRTFQAPHFVDLILLRGGGALPQGTLRTTVDLGLQRNAEEILRERLAPLRSKSVRNAAAVVLDNRTGDVLALAGSEDYFAPGTGQVNGAWAPRSAGSTLKPFTYLLAMERGATPATVIADVPVVFMTPTGAYQPENYHQLCHGPVRLRHALGNSLNIPAVKTLASCGGVEPLQALLTGWGIGTLQRPAAEYGLGLTIGNSEVRLLELVNAYAALARLGEWRPYRLTAEHTQPMPQVDVHRTRADLAWLMADILSDNEARALQFGRWSALRFDFPVASKTGTSTDYHDNWAVGYTPEFTVGVWVGNFDGSAMRDVSGVTGAAPMLHDLFVYLHDRFGTSWYPRPASIVERDVHPLTGKVRHGGATAAIREKFVADMLPPVEEPGDYDERGKVHLGPEYAAWMKAGGGAQIENGVVATDEDLLRIIAPVAGTTFVVDPDVPSTTRLPLVARGRGEVRWESESLRLENAEAGPEAVASEGRHRLVAIDDTTGERAETWIDVKSL